MRKITLSVKHHWPFVIWSFIWNSIGCINVSYSSKRFPTTRFQSNSIELTNCSIKYEHKACSWTKGMQPKSIYINNGSAHRPFDKSKLFHERSILVWKWFLKKSWNIENRVPNECFEIIPLDTLNKGMHITIQSCSCSSCRCKWTDSTYVSLNTREV